jgi:L-ascorbate metabolism protein UlaG (beta-lactamase superfamily)
MTLLKRAEKDGSKFLNPVPTTMADPSTILKLLPLYFNNPAETEPKQPLGPFHTDISVYQTQPVSGLRVTWFGHSASLIEIDGLRVLIDPVWEQRASPVQWLGPKRFFAPTLRLEDLPSIDVVLISHDHYDHLGSETVKRLARLNATGKASWVTSLGVGKRLRQRGVDANHISELDWTQSVEVAGRELGAGLKITAWPARHFSGRGVTDRFKTLWSSFVLEGPRHRVYYGADSGWWEGFAEIAAQYDGFDLTMLEIGAFHPLWANIHLGPDAAVHAYEAMGGKARAGLLMPIHWGLFNLALHGWRKPIERIEELRSAGSLNLFCPKPGVPIDILPNHVEIESWWHK